MTKESKSGTAIIEKEKDSRVETNGRETMKGEKKILAGFSKGASPQQSVIPSKNEGIPKVAQLFLRSHTALKTS
jgi:hypothetical protein